MELTEIEKLAKSEKVFYLYLHALGTTQNEIVRVSILFHASSS